MQLRELGWSWVFNEICCDSYWFLVPLSLSNLVFFNWMAALLWASWAHLVCAPANPRKWKLLQEPIRGLQRWRHSQLQMQSLRATQRRSKHRGSSEHARNGVSLPSSVLCAWRHSSPGACFDCLSTSCGNPKSCETSAAESGTTRRLAATKCGERSG